MSDIVIIYAKSPKLKELFSRKKVGDTCKFEVEMQANEIGTDEVKGTIKVVTYHDGSEEKEVEPSAEEPAMIQMDVGGKKMELETAAY